MAEDLDIDGDNVRVAVVQYSHDASAYFYLMTHKTKKDVVYAVRSLRHKGGRPRNTGAALQFVRDNVFTASAGSRHLQGVPQILFVLTTGGSSDDVTGPAVDLKGLGVLSFGIGLKNAEENELQSISYTSRFLFNLPAFGELMSIQPEILSFIKSKMEVEPPTIVVELDAAMRDIVFLLDGSDGTRNGFPAMRDFVQRVVEKLNVEENKDRVSVVQYSRDPEAHFYLNTHSTKGDVINSIRNLKHKGGRPLNTGAALQFVKDNVFTASAGSRRLEGVPQLLILLSGGRSHDVVSIPASALKEDGIVPLTIGTRDADIIELQVIAHTPSYALSVPGFDDLQSVDQHLLSFVKSVPRLPRPQPTTVVVKTDTTQRDIVFLLDGSDETQNGFQSIRDFVQNVVEKLFLEEDKDRVSVVQFSRDPEAHFYLNTYSTKGDVTNSIRNLRHKGGRPLNTGAALQFVKDNVLTASAGSRRLEGVPQLLILLTGGRSSDDVHGAVTMLKEFGVILLVVGVKKADTLELQMISHKPSYSFSIPNFYDLPSVQQQVVSAITKVTKLTSTDLPSVIADDGKRDIVFLLDGSDDSRTQFPVILNFVQRTVEKFDVENRFSVVQYSNNPEANFYLNTFSTKEDILDAVRGLRHKGGRPLNTGAALQFVKDNVFTASAGSRGLEGVPQILIVLSGKRSRDDIRGPATALKESGVVPFSIGTANADTLEIQTLSHDPKYALSITDFKDLPTMQEQFFALVKEVSHRKSAIRLKDFESKSIKRDIVFLLDGSDDTRNGFEGVRRFIQRLVEKLSMEDNRDQVALVQYSKEATANFYLNSYSTKADVLNSVKSIRHKGGRPLNTGAALQFVKNNVFNTSTGSRRPEPVRQILVVFSGGRSSDDIRGPAQALKNSEIKTFGIGTKNADTLELQTISFTPSHTFSVSDFENLESVQDKIISAMSGAQEILPEMTDFSGKNVVV
ncbi:collagen alpha-3(VI) chain isoform X2 [Anguilla rostrata]|uniref:collagen alpha-3(VI) chain isoform X2 n=1 Tax=Anguilla rostrata TaxID=7938 RepID=UPI0030D0391D